MNDRLRLVAVALPIVLLAFMVGRAEWHLADSQTYHFAVRGYDPRDLLRGHYLRFGLALPVAETIEACRVDEAACCYCLEPGSGLEPRLALATCETARATCDAFVRTAPLHAMHRFYIPEEGRRELEQRLRVAAGEDRAHLAVAVSRSGEPLIEALLVDGVPIEAAVAADEQGGE